MLSTIVDLFCSIYMTFCVGNRWICFIVIAQWTPLRIAGIYCLCRFKIVLPLKHQSNWNKPLTQWSREKPTFIILFFFFYKKIHLKATRAVMCVLLNSECISRFFLVMKKKKKKQFSKYKSMTCDEYYSNWIVVHFTSFQLNAFQADELKWWHQPHDNFAYATHSI